MVATSRAEIDAFLAQRRIAVVGVTRNPREFANTLFRDLRQRGYQAIPVNPNAQTIEGERCYARVQEIAPAVDAALLLTAPSLNEQIVADCANAGIKRIWFYGVGDRSAENAKAIAFCRERGIAVIPGFCPYMFLPRAPFYHSIHGFFARLAGLAPR
jgi:predicted CoA-binding protein